MIHHDMASRYITTFASQRRVFEGKNEAFLLENASNLTHEFLYENLNESSRRNGSFISPPKGISQKRKC